MNKPQRAQRAQRPAIDWSLCTQDPGSRPFQGNCFEQTTEGTEAAENSLDVLCALCVLCGLFLLFMLFMLSAGLM